MNIDFLEVFVLLYNELI